MTSNEELIKEAKAEAAIAGEVDPLRLRDIAWKLIDALEDTGDADAADTVAHRYLAESLTTHRLGFPEFDFDELRPVLDFVRDKFPEPGQGAILHAYDSIMREFSKGHRCSVCGRTAKQNATLGYDCAREC